MRKKSKLKPQKDYSFNKRMLLVVFLVGALLVGGLSLRTAEFSKLNPIQERESKQSEEPQAKTNTKPKTDNDSENVSSPDEAPVSNQPSPDQSRPKSKDKPPKDDEPEPPEPPPPIICIGEILCL